MAKRNKQYSAEFKQDAVNHCYSSGKTLEKAASDLKVATSTLSTWVTSANKNDGLVEHRGSGNYSFDAEKEIARLKKELKDSKGNPWDNACIESFHAFIKREWLNRYVIKNTKHAHQLVFEYIETFYNTTSYQPFEYNHLPFFLIKIPNEEEGEKVIEFHYWTNNKQTVQYEALLCPSFR